MASTDADQDCKTPEAQAFRIHYGRLLKAIQESELPSLGADLFSECVISSVVLEQMGKQALTRAEKSTKLLLAMMSHLEINPGKFERVMKIIGQEPTLESIASDIKKTYDLKSAPNPMASPSTTTQQQCSAAQTDTESAISRYSVYLKKLYKRTKLPMKNKLSSLPCKKIIRLAVVEKHSSQPRDLSAKMITYKSQHSVDQLIQDANITPIEAHDILKMDDGSQPKCVIVQGAPGIGKSTFAWKACRKWGKGRLFQEYDLVVLLRMRDTYVREAKNLRDFFHSPDKNLSREVATEVIDKNGKGMLFILEGIDELPASILDDDNSILMELLQGILLPDVTILVTTRPWAVHAILEKCGGQISRHIEILGFRKEDISRYISHSFSEEEQEEFHQYLSTQPHIYAIMYVPLHAAIVIQIYLERKHTQKPLPVTMTQLYTALVLSLIARHIKCLPEYKDIKVEDLKSLPEPILEHFEQLCALAYSGFTKPSIQVVFSDSDLPSSADTLGLMHSTSDILGYSVGYAFSHITIQEFLAAYHLSLQSKDVVEDFVLKNLASPVYRDVLCFLSGMSRFILIEAVRNSILQVSEPTINQKEKHMKIHSTQYLHWIYEGQLAEKCKDILTGDVVSVNFVKQKHCSSPFDIHALHYCIRHSCCCWNIMLLALSSTLQALPPHQPCANSVDQYREPGKYNNTRVCVMFGSRGENVSPVSFSLTLRIIPSFLEARAISLVDCCNISPDYLARTSRSVPPIDQADSQCVIPSDANLHFLEHFSLCGVLLSNDSAVRILEAIQTKSPCITTISLPLTNVGRTDTRAVILICKIMTMTKTLKYLDLSGNFLSSDSLQLLFSALASSDSLTNLSISGNIMTPSDVEFLSVSLSLNQCLCELYLDWCGINGEGAEHLAVGLSQNICLQYLSLRRNKIEVAGACALADMLKENSSLQVLDISDDCSIRAKGAECLILSLEINCTMKQLNLSKELSPYLGHLYDVDFSNRFSFVENNAGLIKLILYFYYCFTFWFSYSAA